MLNLVSLYVTYESGSSLSFNKKKIRAVEETNLTIGYGETVGLVGESGCGKSTLGRAILGLVKIEKGRMEFEGTALHELNSSGWRGIRKDIQVVFQDPYSSLNPRMTVEEIVTEGLYVHFPNLSRMEKHNRAIKILDRVNLPSDSLERFPHEFSGGQRQRLAVARALILNPKFLILDEAVSALDISTQASVLNLLIELKKDYNLSYLFISHDLGIVKYISDRIAVMYLGKIVETGNKEDIIRSPKHPYTKSLFDSIFDLRDRKKKRTTIKGEIPSVLNKPSGCYFHTRCPLSKDICRSEKPVNVGNSFENSVYCHFPLS